MARWCSECRNAFLELFESEVINSTDPEEEIAALAESINSPGTDSIPADAPIPYYLADNIGGNVIPFPVR